MPSWGSKVTEFTNSYKFCFLYTSTVLQVFNTALGWQNKTRKRVRWVHTPNTAIAGLMQHSFYWPVLLRKPEGARFQCKALVGWSPGHNSPIVCHKYWHMYLLTWRMFWNNMSRSEQAPGSGFHPHDQNTKIYCFFGNLVGAIKNRSWKINTRPIIWKICE